MSKIESLSERAELRFWGWGYADEHLSAQEDQLVEAMVSVMAPNNTEIAPPSIDDFDLPPPRLELPEVLTAFVSTTKYDRLVHSYGKSYPDIVRMFLHQIDNPPDWVAFPKTEQQISELLAYASKNNIAVIPFGGGTSVCGGVESDIGKDYQASVSLDLEYFNLSLIHI